QLGALWRPREGRRVSEAVAAADDHVGLFRTEAALSDEFLEVHERRVDIRWPEFDGFVDDLARPARIVRWGDEYVPAHRGHLGPSLVAGAGGPAFSHGTW